MQSAVESNRSPSWWAKFDAQWLVIGISLSVVAVLALVPFCFMVWQSFYTPETVNNPAKFTWGNYTTAYTNPETVHTFWNSVKFALGDSLLAFVIGTALAWMNERTNTPMRRLFYALSIVNTWCFTDWIYRPRRADELDAALGGAVTFRQGAHQFDILRLLCGGMAHSVKARTFDWDTQRPATGAHSVFIDFGQGGPAATAVYNGYGGLSSMDLCFDISEWGFHQPPQSRSWHTRAALPTSAQAALAAKQARATGAIPPSAPHQPFFGLTIVSCERGDIRQPPPRPAHSHGARRAGHRPARRPQPA